MFGSNTLNAPGAAGFQATSLKDAPSRIEMSRPKLACARMGDKKTC